MNESTDRDVLAAILAKHEFWAGVGCCSCKYDCEPFDDGHEGEARAHRAHVAQMVLESDWLRDLKADVWEARGQVEHATWCIYGDPDQGRTCPADNPYRADRVDAEDGGR